MPMHKGERIMKKLNADLLGVRVGDVYPTLIAAGEDCPPELEAAAQALGILDEADAAPEKAKK
jgi:hypothetical protein